MKNHSTILLLLLLACAQPNTSENNTSSDADEVSSTETLSSPAEGQKLEEVTYEESQVSEPVVRVYGAMVYVTEDGDKYHTADCRYSETAHLVKLSQAKANGKTACGVCKPNSKTGEKQARCAGTTGEGKQCQRMTTDASGKCFQHRVG